MPSVSRDQLVVVKAPAAFYMAAAQVISFDQSLISAATLTFPDQETVLGSSIRQSFDGQTVDGPSRHIYESAHAPL